MSVLYFWVNGDGTVVKHNWSNAVGVIRGEGSPFLIFILMGVFFHMQRKDNKGLFDLWSS